MGPFLRVGERTRQLEGAHVEFLSGVKNPVGAKVGPSATPAEIVALAERLVQAYYQAVSSLNLLRAFTKGGFADLTQVHTWNQEFVASSLEGQRYEVIANEIGRALRFMQAIGIDLGDERSIHEVDVWTSHEALLLDYEEPLVRKESTTGDWYACSGHFLWVGERMRQLDGANVEFLSGLHNPIGAKVAAKTRPLGAGTIVGSGTVSNRDRKPGAGCLFERRAEEIIKGGEAKTPFLKYGDRVRIEMAGADGRSIFGAIDQKITPAQA